MLFVHNLDLRAYFLKGLNYSKLILMEKDFFVRVDSIWSKGLFIKFKRILKTVRTENMLLCNL